MSNSSVGTSSMNRAPQARASGSQSGTIDTGEVSSSYGRGGDGHPAGDQVIVAVAHTMKNNLRPTDLVARYGGEEFLIILPETDREQGRMVGDRVRAAVAALAFEIEGSPELKRATISLGGATLQAGQTMADLVTGADRMLYESKHGGRNRVTF